MNLLGGIDEGKPAVKLLFGLLGLGLILLIWLLLTSGETPVLPSVILPHPWSVLSAFSELFNKNELLKHLGFSIGLNIAGYIEAIAIALPVGFAIGLFKYLRWGFQRQIDAVRYLPLTALLGLFIVWFGIESPMKIHFLAFGILIYLLPIIVQRIDEVSDVYLKTTHTLGATDWQIIKTVYLPSVLSRLSDDIRVLTAISWTYIIVAETIASRGGIGNLIWSSSRQARTDKVFALLLIIMLVGIIQDKIFVWLDRELFPHKYQARDAVKSSKLEQKSAVSIVLDYALTALGWIAMAVYVLLMINEFIPILGNVKPLSYLFGSTTWVIHLVVILFLLFRGWKWMQHQSDLKALASVKTQTAKS